MSKDFVEKHIKTVADIKENIGNIVYWDNVSRRYSFLRSDLLVSYEKGIVRIGNNDLTLSEVKNLSGLRNFKGNSYE